MVLRKYKDEEQDRKTLVAVREARGAMEAVEYAYFKEGSASADDVVRVRDEYLEVWEARRNFVLAEKFNATAKVAALEELSSS